MATMRRCKYSVNLEAPSATTWNQLFRIMTYIQERLDSSIKEGGIDGCEISACGPA